MLQLDCNAQHHGVSCVCTRLDVVSREHLWWNQSYVALAGQGTGYQHVKEVASGTQQGQHWDSHAICCGCGVYVVGWWDVAVGIFIYAPRWRGALTESKTRWCNVME